MIRTVDRVAPAVKLVPLAVAAAWLLVAGGAGGAGVAPTLAVGALAVVLAAPMRWTALAMLAAALIADNPGERPSDGQWQSPLFGPGAFLYENLHKLTGIDALRFSAIELTFGLLMLVVVVRKIKRDRIDDPLGLGWLSNPMEHAFAAFFAAIVALELYGLASGGDFKNSLWQLRQMFWLPVLGVVFGHAIKSAGARTGLLRLLLAAAFIRCLFGIYFYAAIARPQAMAIEYSMTHSDSILIVVAMVIGLTILIERFSTAHLLLNAMVQPIYFAGLVVNDRRVAYVTLAAAVLSLVLLGPPYLRVWLRRATVVLVPVLLLYTAAGWNSGAGIFKPVQTFRSLSSRDDASSQTRDIENYNLTLTLKRHPVLGSGFGHEYVEFVQGNRVDQIFAQYRYIAHNSVLWLLSLAGWLWFSILWSLFPAAVLMARRVYDSSRTPIDRTTAFAAFAAVLCFVVQAWADMGLQSWMGTLVVASLMGATGALWTARCAGQVDTCM